jgi:hypothetical protein
MDKRNCHGLYEWKEGHSYEGFWVDDKRHGHGIQKWQDGTSYEGEWKNDTRHGHGIQKSKDGSFYDGEWENDKHHGHGVLNWPDGRSYVGQWADGKRHGKGIFTLANGCICHCTWENDCEISGIATWPDGRIYKGSWKNKRVGVGILTYPDGDVFHVDSEAGIYVLNGETCALPNISIYHTYDEPVPGLGAYDGPIWTRIQHEIGLDNLYDLIIHFFDLEQDPNILVCFFEQVVSHEIAVSCTEFIVERWGKHTIPKGMNRYEYLRQFTIYKPAPLIHTQTVAFDNGTSCVYQMTRLSRLPNTLVCLDEHRNKIEWSCSICMSDSPETHKIKRAWLSCGHSFHNTCIFEWLSNKSNCPCVEKHLTRYRLSRIAYGNFKLI